MLIKPAKKASPLKKLRMPLYHKFIRTNLTLPFSGITEENPRSK